MKPLQIRNHQFNWGKRTYIMGIINITPDSFSGDGLLTSEAWIDRAVAQGQQFVTDGADILDIGGESTRPGAAQVEVDEELKRVVPAIEALRQIVDVPISIDTYKAKVANAAIRAGADMVNDVWSLQMDSDMATVCASHKIPVVLMHNRSTPRNAVQEAQLGGRYIGTKYGDLLGDIASELQHSIRLAKQVGIPNEHIILDTGIGFGKTVAQNLQLLNRTDYFKLLGHPLLIGPSNKSFIGYTLNLPPEDRMEGTAAAVTMAIARGADIVRVHQVKQMVRVAQMADAIVRG
ncbi:dihydropteroate synthase [Anaerolineales bacterium HSG24]|nr:dihydropteroate synthase [Anaerolineales bacterium HSG24]